MNPEQRIQLDKMIKQNDSVDNTELIRELKHSSLITKEINTILKIKKRLNNNYIDDFASIDKECLNHCRFLFDNYTNIYNKLLKDQVDLKVLYKFLYHLKQIEDGVLNQHEASFEIGTLLKKMYIDPIIEDKPPNERKALPVSWNEYKNMNCI